MKQRNKDGKLSTIYSRCLITRNIVLPITSIGTNIREIINKKIHDNYEGKCLVEGFIEKNSTKIVSHSSGLIQRGTNITFVVVFECNVCFPVEGTLISCIAKNITKAGIRAESSDEMPSPIVVFIARDHHYNSEQFNEIKEGDKFTARVIGQRFELNDKYVSIIAELKVERKIERKIERKPVSSKKAKGIVIKNDIVLSEDSDSDEN
jgi:DNA-directed RNA polymerase subunit E'/Rpb7